MVKDRECRRLRERFEQLTRMRDEHREWSAAQLDEALRTAEATEDAVHAVSVGTSAPSIRDAAEIDKLRLTLSAIREQGAVERSQLEEQIQRDEVSGAPGGVRRRVGVVGGSDPMLHWTWTLEGGDATCGRHARARPAMAEESGPLIRAQEHKIPERGA